MADDFRPHAYRAGSDPEARRGLFEEQRGATANGRIVEYRERGEADDLAEAANRTEAENGSGWTRQLDLGFESGRDEGGDNSHNSAADAAGTEDGHQLVFEGFGSTEI